MQNLVSIEWLSEHFEHSDIVILDASTSSNAAGLIIPFPNLQIVGARAFDFTARFSDENSPLPNTMPSPEHFEKECQKLGIRKSSRIVVYDNLGIYAAPRVWWMFKIMGHANVAVLDGGLPAWKRADLACEVLQTQQGEFDKGDFQADYQSALVKSKSQVLDKQCASVIDARSRARFDGLVPEARAHLKSGHIPGSKNLPFLDLLNDGHFLSEELLEARLESLDIGDEPLIFSCGSGVTACILILGLSLVRPNRVSLYDGSWAEWGQLDDAFIEK